MKLCICTDDIYLKSNIAPNFGRCQYFLIIDLDTDKIENIKNQGTKTLKGAGVSAVQIMVSKGIKSVIAQNFGPNAFSALLSSGIKAFTCEKTTAENALEKYIKEELIQIDRPTIQ